MDCRGQQHQQLLVAVVQVAAVSVLVLMQLQVQGRWLELALVWLQGLVEGVWEPKEGLALSPRLPLAPCTRLHQPARSCLLA